MAMHSQDVFAWFDCFLRLGADLKFVVIANVAGNLGGEDAIDVTSASSS